MRRIVFQSQKNACAHKMLSFGVVPVFGSAASFFPVIFGKLWTTSMTKTSIHLDLFQTEFDETFSRVKKALQTTPDLLEIDLIGKGNVMSPDDTLVLYYFVKERDPKTKILVNCRTSLMGAHILLLLMADYRTVRKGTTLWFDDPARLGEEDYISKLKEIRYTQAKLQTYYDYLHVCALASEYLPLEEIVDRRFPLERLADYGLLYTAAQEKTFEKLFS